MPADVPQFAVRDGDARIVYVVANRRLYKYFPDSNTVMPMLTFTGSEQGHMVGYAGYYIPVPQAATIEVIIPSATGVWHVVDGVWTLKSNGLPIGRAWKHIAADPLSPDTWLLVGGATGEEGDRVRSSGSNAKVVAEDGYSPLWFTSDAGQTWQEVLITATSLNFSSVPLAMRAEFTGLVIGEWGYGGVVGGFSDGSRRYLAYRGTGTSGSEVAVAVNPSGANDAIGAATVALGGDVVYQGGYGRLWHQQPAQALTYATGADLGQWGASSIDHKPGSTELWLTGGGAAVYKTPNYRTTGVSGIAVPNTVRSVSVNADGTKLLLANGPTKPVYMDTATNAITDAVDEAVTTVGYGRYDRQTRTAWAVRITSEPNSLTTGNKDCWIFDGVNVARLVGPAAAAANSLYNVLDVIVRGGS